MQGHITDRVDFSKFGVPSWRIEQRYNTGVLIGNWSGERQAFPVDKYSHNSTNRIDFKAYGGSLPDVIARRKQKLAGEGIPAEMLFRHHGKAYDSMKITLYDENFNGRWTEKNLPALRKWDRHSMGWMPEKSDKPLTGAPTNFGLKEAKEAEQEARRKEINKPSMLSTYSDSYAQAPSGDAMRFHRYANPKAYSTTLLPSNKVNNDLHLRGQPNLRMPELLPQELTQVSV